MHGCGYRAYLLPWDAAYFSFRQHYIRSVRYYNHWNENVVILTKFSSLAAPKVVILTTFGTASDEDFVKMKTFPFQWCVFNAEMLEMWESHNWSNSALTQITCRKEKKINFRFFLLLISYILYLYVAANNMGWLPGYIMLHVHRVLTTVNISLGPVYGLQCKCIQCKYVQNGIELQI